MKKFIPLIMLLMTASAANAGGLVTKHASSVQLTVDAARTTATRIGSSFSISGQTLILQTVAQQVVSAGTITSGVYNPGTITALRIQRVPHSPSVNLILKAMQFQLVQLL